MGRMANCGGCGRESSRRRITFPPKGPNIEVCEYCGPSLAEAKFASSTDRRLWMGHEVEPEKYDRVDRGDGSSVFVAKDEKRVDDEAELMGGPSTEETRAEAIMAARRTMGRKTPLTDSEVVERVAQIKGYLGAA